MLRHASRLRFASVAVLLLSLVDSPQSDAQAPPTGSGVVVGIQAQPTQRTPPRDFRPQAQKVGTAVIRGTVVTAGTGQPIARAIVTATGSGGRAGAVTDAEGRFELAQLPAGSYNLTVQKNLYLTGGYKQRRPNGPSQPIVVKDGEVVEGIVISLTRYGAITGRVLDAYGEPASDVAIHVIADATGGRRRPRGRSMMSSNDIGEFRVPRLEPGNYIVCAIPRVGGGNRPTSFTFTSGPVGGVVGGVVGGIPGGVVTSVMSGMPDGTGESATPTCYPSSDFSQAQPIVLPPGQEFHDLTITLRAGAAGRVAGLVLNSAGQPAAQASVSLLARFGSGAASWIQVGGSGTRPDGSFSFEGVAPGEYRLVATIWHPPVDGRRSDEQRGLLNVTTGGGDLDGLVINVGQLAVITGRVLFETSEAKPPAQVRVSTMPADDSERGWPGSTQTDAEYRFELRNLYGVQYLTVGDTGSLRLKSITHRGRDLTDVPLDLKPGDRLTDVEIVLTSQTTRVEGAVAAPNAMPGEYVIVMFSQNPERWRLRSRYVRMSGNDRTGRFRIENAPPDQYYIAAWRRLDLDFGFEDMYDREFLERLRPLATSVTVLEGDTRELSLSPITLPER